jgi:hypothetical protein
MADGETRHDGFSDERALHRRWAVTLFNGTWEFMERSDRSADEDAEMAHMAHASLYHWLQIGGPENAARGEWQCSRVYCVLGRSEPALYHARRVLDICRRHSIGDWDLAYAHEALARAFALAGDAGQAKAHLEEATRASEQIADEGDRRAVLADLATISATPAG